MTRHGAPDVPAWMLRDPAPLRATAGAFRADARSLDELAGRLEGLLGDTAASLGWRTRSAASAQARAARGTSQLRLAGTAVAGAGTALAALAGALEVHGPDLQAAQRTRTTRMPMPEPSPELVRLDASIEEATGYLALRDRHCAAALEDAADALERLTTLAHEDDWLGTAAAPEVLATLRRVGLIESAAARTVLDAVLLLPPGAEGAAVLRRMLSRLGNSELATFLVAHPEVARRLGKGGLAVGATAPGTPEARLAAAVEAASRLDPKSRVEAVRAAFATMSAQERRRVALLYPDVLGNLDGAPLADRFAANRVSIAVALQVGRERELELDRLVSSPPHQAIPDPSAARLGSTALAKLRKTLTYYERLLHEVPNGVQGAPGHQILVFDPAGDGRIAEVWGDVNASSTRHVGVFVPGTGAEMSNFDRYSKLAKGLGGKQSSNTVMVVWLGSDMPDSPYRNAPKWSYSQKAGPQLRDFVWGLGVPPAADTTVVGHSYGGAVAGVAERLGMEIDRVVHVESAGEGHGVDSVADYAPGHHVDRYTMTAPGDPIRISQGVHVGSVGHGADPQTDPGFIHLETGRFAPGTVVDGRDVSGHVVKGLSAHSNVLVPGTTAWENIHQVIIGGDVVLETPASHPSYEQGSKVDIE